MSRASTAARRGAVLLVVAGFAALIAALTIAFLARARDGADDTDALVREAQARIMLVAACQYLQEASRIGWDDSAQHRETFGWIDERDGQAGPKFAAGPADDSRFPIGATARCPMDAWRRPPFAQALTAVYNPMQQDESAADFALPYLRRPDPEPALDPAIAPAARYAAAAFATWSAGDPRPLPEAQGLAWFRVRRVGIATFVVTCGGGASEGFANWPEVVSAHADDRFAGDSAVFASLVAREARLWYVVEWSPAVLAPEYQNIFDSYNGDGGGAWTGQDHYVQWPLNASQSHQIGNPVRSQTHARNCGGTIRWVQRLAGPPEAW